MMDKIDSNFKMLEIKNVTKIYKTKGGVITRALDGVSISFGEKGLVFLLGKSGSGKSTLLNVSGGLDEPTSGEVVVKGKSSKDFTGSDFDSYRNTFVGFIFQEYNILDEFNVEDNIALALELQGKPKDREKINKLLCDVELEPYAKRKPNTLSGGQKQRIAIARALIKDPQIIMADEPTGALDSATGKQVFDTLKKLSETRLVIVVSHDREFAEIYGDRIIELKDGKIISDVSKSHIPPQRIDGNISVIGGNTLSIKKGSTLTAENIKTIQDFIKGTDGDIIISNGRSEIENFKKANRMSESGSTEKFDATAEDALTDKQYTKEESRFIRSRLPAAKAIKIGASGLKLKPVRLVFTILLSFIAFTMFGLFSTLMTYNGVEVAANSFADSGLNYLNLSKYYRAEITNDWGHGDVYTYTGRTQVQFTEAELEELRNAYGENTYGYYSASGSISNVSTTGETYYSYYQAEISNYAYVADGNPLLDNLQGKYPETTDEICISSYMLDVFKNNVFCKVTLDDKGRPENYSNKNTVTVSTAYDVIGQYVVLNLGGRERVFKITGVFDSGQVDSKYEELKEGDFSDYLLIYSYLSYLQRESTHKMALVSEDFYDEFAEVFEYRNDSFVQYFDYSSNNFTFNYNRIIYDWETDKYEPDLNIDDSDFLGDSVKAFGGEQQLETHFFGAQKSELADDEMVIHIEQLIRMYDSSELTELYYSYRDGYYQEYNGETHEWEEIYLTKDELQQAYEKIVLMLEENHTAPIEVEVLIDGLNVYNMKIVGYYIPSADIWQNGIYFSQNFIDLNVQLLNNGFTQTTETKYVRSPDEKYSGIMLEYDGTAGTYRNLAVRLGIDNADESDVFLIINNSLYDSVEMANYYAGMLSTVFLWVGVVFAAFSALLLFNFITVSISNKRKEIGILRAVGARGLDVFKIFFSESGIIVGICTVLAVVGTLVICFILNSVLKNMLGLGVSLFVFGIVSVAMMVGIALVVAIISTFLPVFFASRKKPVESIRAI